jgi:hypothetical protein
MRRGWLFGLMGLMLAALPLAARAELASDRPLADARTINALLSAHPGDEFHIVLVHGIRTSDRTTWSGFRGKLCEHLAAPHRCAAPAPTGPVTEKLVLRAKRPAGNFLGTPIWSSDEAFWGSLPFVDHYTYQLEDGRSLVLDEVNWWPLALALKCQFLVRDETDLVGANAENITNCTAIDALHFGWFDTATAQQLLAARPSSGGAPVVNRKLKTDILDWGISDAVLSLGTMKGLLRETIRCSFDDILLPERRSYAEGPAATGAYQCLQAAPESAPRGAHKSFVMVSHSLGSFLLLDTFAAAAGNASYGAPEDPCRQLVQRSTFAFRAPVAAGPEEAARTRPFDQSLCVALSSSSNLYFLANQFSLLELGRAQGLDASVEYANVKDALSLWAGSPGADAPRQLMAFSDPGDLLTFKVPAMAPAEVYNVFPHNDFSWFGLVEWPMTAHTRYLTNDRVLRVIFGR